METDQDFSPRFSLSITSTFNIVARVVGLIVMLIGLWAALKVINVAWGLYQNPQSIEQWSQAVEEGSHVNAYSHTFHRQIANKLATPQQAPELKENETLRISYFIAWGIVVVLLMLIGRVAFWALQSGGTLAIYNADVEKVAKAMVQEILRNQNALHTQKKEII